jgi:ABC-2 type transport system permease protein
VAEGVKELKGNHSSLFVKLSVILILIIIADIILLNIAGMIMDKKFMLHADLSRDKVLTLSSETRHFLASLKEDIVIYGVYEKRGEDKVMSELLGKYGESSSRIKVKFVNPLTNLSLIMAFDPQNRGIETGTVIISDTERKNYMILTYYDLYVISKQHGIVGIKAEQTITSAIRYIVSGRRPRIVFMEGHDEILPSKMSSLISELDSLNYDVRSLNLQETKVELSPADDVLLFAGPEKDLTNEEFDILSSFLSSSGKAIFLMDNIIVDTETSKMNILGGKLSNFSKLLKLYSLNLKRDVIIGENMAFIGQRPTKLIVNVIPHHITKNMISAPGKRPILSEVSSIDIGVVPSGSMKITPLLVTDEQCYTKLLDENSLTMKRQTQDERGSFLAGVLSEGRGKIILLGTSSIAVQGEYSLEGNRLFFLSTLAYLSDTEMLDIKPKIFIDGTLNLGSAANRVLVIILVTVVMPLVMIMTGIFVTKKRSRIISKK